MRMNENAKHDIDFYKYVLMKIADAKSDICEKVSELDNPNFYNCKEYSDSISSITGLESLVDSIFFKMCTGDICGRLYDEIIINLNCHISRSHRDLDEKSIISFKSSKEFMNNAHEEWLNRKDDSDGK